MPPLTAAPHPNWTPGSLGNFQFTPAPAPTAAQLASLLSASPPQTVNLFQNVRLQVEDPKPKSGVEDVKEDVDGETLMKARR